MGDEIIGLESLVNDEGGKKGFRNEDERLRNEIFVKSNDRNSIVRQFLRLIYLCVLVTSVIGTKEGMRSNGLDSSDGVLRVGNFRVFTSKCLDEAIESNTSANLNGMENCMQKIVIKVVIIGSGTNFVLSNNESVIERNNDECKNAYINKYMNINKNVISFGNNDSNVNVSTNNKNTIVNISSDNKDSIVYINTSNKIGMIIKNNNRRSNEIDVDNSYINNTNRNNIDVNNNNKSDRNERYNDAQPRDNRLEGSVRKGEKPRVDIALVGSSAQTGKSAKYRIIEKTSGEEGGEMASETFASSTRFASNEGFPSMGEKGQQKAPGNDGREGVLSRNWDLGDAAINSASTQTDKLTLSADYREGVDNVNVRATEGEVGIVADLQYDGSNDNLNWRMDFGNAAA